MGQILEAAQRLTGQKKLLAANAIGLDEWRTSSLQRPQLSKEAFANEGVISNGRCLHR